MDRKCNGSSVRGSSKVWRYSDQNSYYYNTCQYYEYVLIFVVRTTFLPLQTLRRQTWIHYVFDFADILAISSMPFYPVLNGWLATYFKWFMLRADLHQQGRDWSP